MQPLTSAGETEMHEGMSCSLGLHWVPESAADGKSTGAGLGRWLALKQWAASLPQVGSHRLSVYEEWDPFRFRHMIPTEALQVRALPTAGEPHVCQVSISSRL